MSPRRPPGETVGRPALPRWLGFVTLSLLGLWGLIVPSAAQWFATNSDVLEPLPRGQVNWTDGVVQGRDSATGSTRPRASGATSEVATQAARQSVRTALAHVRLDAKQTLAARLEQGAEAQQGLDALVAQAEVVEMRYVAGGDVEAVVQVPIAGQLTALVLPPGPGARPASEPGGDAVHSGIVIDARGLAIQPALLPRVVDESGQALYTPEAVDTEAAVQQGYVAYAKAFDQAPAQARIGARPLVLRALRVVEATRVDLVLSHTDAARLRDYTATRRLLQQCRVLIVM